MTDQIALFEKIFSNQQDQLTLSGIDSEQFHCLYNIFVSDEHKDNHAFIYVFADEESAENFFQISKLSNPKTLFYPTLGSDIYSSIIPSESNLFERFNVVSKISQDPSFSVVTTYQALYLNLPEISFFQDKSFEISISDIIGPSQLAEQLVKLGYNRAFSVEEPGTFSNRGEIFDIYPLGQQPIRIYYFDEMIEEIFLVDPDTLKTLRNKKVEKVLLEKTPYSLLAEEHTSIFKEKFPRPKSNEKQLFDYRQEVFRKINNQNFFEDYPLFVGLFTEESSSLLSFCKSHKLLFFDFFKINDEFTHFREDLFSQYQNYLEQESKLIKPSPDLIYDFSFNPQELSHLNINNLNIEHEVNLDISNSIDLSLKPIIRDTIGLLYTEQIQKLASLIKDRQRLLYNVFLLYSREETLKEIKYLLQTYLEEKDYNRIFFKKGVLSRGFEYSNERILILSESDFFHSKTKKSKTKSKNFESDLFADQLSTLEVGDYIIHKDFGIGKYLGVQTLNLNGSNSDYITLEYQDEDKVYVPIYRLNLLQKYSSNQIEVSVANLKSKKFDVIKSKARTSVKKLAFDLLELQAKRKLQTSYAFSIPSHEYTDFSLSFPYVETEDQSKAIEDVLEDMQSQKPMDRLVCGDVGFGKTEVAMRASFLAVLDSKQVCILVPTTVLGLQHFNSFKERFKDFPVNIDFVSRLKTPKQTSEVLEKLKEGKIDILIGTHKLLSDKVKFKDLGLVVIDEEQRFGVAHKEKLKLLRETVDTLTLTATPIPRTLQLSFLGIKDLSIIKTPPPRRQSIKTYIIKEDNNTIKSAIEKEINRGGQVFIVHNKVQDIEIFTGKIRNLVPKARIIFAHGQLSPRDLEKRISDFYAHKYDILIATTIIESGIDIPNANTMIIDRADTYGLSQLHQLRGRIGRSDKKAYAYFVIPNNRNLSEIAAKRLKALQTYAEIGSGFSLASSDLEIRGSGDILGPEQSGHLANIGLELYMELLQEAIQNIKGEKSTHFQDIEIISGFNTLIPESYIENSAQRIKYYKKLSNKKSLADIQDTIEEITDQYGPLPTETKNLCLLLESRLVLQGLGITRLKIQTQSVIINFDQKMVSENPDLQNKIIQFFMQRPKIYKINPDFSINCKFKDKISIEDFNDFAKYIAEQIHIC